MSDEKKGFTVKDRRLFTPEGELRGDEPTEDVEPTDVERSPELAPQPAPTSIPPGSPEGEALLGDEVSFASFLMSLAAQASALLDGENAAELDGARQIVSILEMLKDKTSGRRTPEEDRVLEGLLYELRMAYVERARMARA